MPIKILPLGDSRVEGNRPWKYLFTKYCFE
jgi:hypothetical protein